MFILKIIILKTPFWGLCLLNHVWTNYIELIVLNCLSWGFGGEVVRPLAFYFWWHVWFLVGFSHFEWSLAGRRFPLGTLDFPHPQGKNDRMGLIIRAHNNQDMIFWWCCPCGENKWKENHQLTSDSDGRVVSNSFVNECNANNGPCCFIFSIIIHPTIHPGRFAKLITLRSRWCITNL